MTAALELFPAGTDYGTPEWTRLGGMYGKLGVKHVHRSGWAAIHCGHPTALWPWYLDGPNGEEDPEGRRTWNKLADAKEAILEIVGG